MKNNLFISFFLFFLSFTNLEGQKEVCIAIDTSAVHIASLSHSLYLEDFLAIDSGGSIPKEPYIPTPIHRFNSDKYSFLLYYPQEKKCREFVVNLGAKYDYRVFYAHPKYPKIENTCVFSEAIVVCKLQNSLQNLLFQINARDEHRTYIKIKENKLYKGAVYLDKQSKRACYIIAEIIGEHEIRIQEIFLLDTDWQIIPKKVCIVPEHVFLNYTPLPPNVIPDRHNMKGGSPMRCVYLPKFNNKPKKGRVHIIDYLRKNNLVVKEPFPWSEVFED
jgi:hypothetical protein